MKPQFKALTITLGLIALLGACTSVNSSTPSTEIPSDESSVELTPDGAEVQNPELNSETTEIETSDEIGTTEEVVEPETAEIETSDEMGTTEEVVEPETAEIETPEVEASESSDIESNTDLESTTQDGEILVPDTVGNEVDETSKSSENVETKTAPELEPAQ